MERCLGVPVFSGADVRSRVGPEEALAAVRRAFLEHAQGAWTMPPKVYLSSAPYGDFRAMPAAGSGYALLKWVTSFPGNSLHGLPTVTGLVLLSDGRTGALCALLDAASVTAIRTGAAAVLAAETLARPDAGAAAVVGCGVNGRSVARTFVARGREVILYDVRPEAAESARAELGPLVRVAEGIEEALDQDIVVTVTPGHELVIHPGRLRPGQHLSLMGADAPEKAEIAVEELERARVVCDEWQQASHSGDIARAVRAGRLRRDDVAELGQVLLGTSPGRQNEQEITVFDSTGLAVQDLGIALVVLDDARGQASRKGA